MIRTDAEHTAARVRMEEQAQRLLSYEKELREKGVPDEQIKTALDPVRSFHAQLAEEVTTYERLRRGEFEDLTNLHGLGQLLVALRIARGVTQRELAAKLKVHESQVSRDERHQYHGITIERASRILDAMELELRTTNEPVKPSVSYRLQDESEQLESGLGCETGAGADNLPLAA